MNRTSAPRTLPPDLIESDYAARLVAIVDRIRGPAGRALERLDGILRRGIVDRDVKPENMPQNMRLDEDPGRRARNEMERVRAEVERGWSEPAFEGVAHDFAMRVSAHQRTELRRQAEHVLGRDLITHDPHLSTVVTAFIHHNVTLIRSLQGRSLDELEKLMVRAATSGTHRDVLAAEIEARFGMSERHARMIARDQIGKLNAQITRARHAEVGITAYFWSHTPQPRPRPHHVARHGRRFQYARPPADGHPGTQPCCKCGQEPDFDSIGGDLDIEAMTASLFSGGRGIGLERVVGEAEAGAVELAPAPDWSMEPGMSQIAGEEEVEPRRRHMPGPGESMLDYLARRKIDLYGPGGYVHPTPAPRPRPTRIGPPGPPPTPERTAAPLPRAQVVPRGILAQLGAAVRRVLRLDLGPPPGWDADGRELRDGVPARDQIAESARYVVPVAELADHVVASPDGGDGSGPVTERRLGRVREAWADGAELPPVWLGMMPDGRLLVIDGRHRLLVALEQGRDVLVRFGTARDGEAPSAVALAPAD